MLVVDASCVVELLLHGPADEEIARRISGDPDMAAPHVVDVEVLGVIRRARLLGQLDATAAALAVEDLCSWPAERYGHRLLLRRAWELRHSVRGWDAMYVALAEALDAPLLTRDARLSSAKGPQCHIEVVVAPTSS